MWQYMYQVVWIRCICNGSLPFFNNKVLKTSVHMEQWNVQQVVCISFNVVLNLK